MYSWNHFGHGVSGLWDDDDDDDDEDNNDDDDDEENDDDDDDDDDDDAWATRSILWVDKVLWM